MGQFEPITAKEIEADQESSTVPRSRHVSRFSLDAAIAFDRGKVGHYSEPRVFTQLNGAFAHVDDRAAKQIAQRIVYDEANAP